MLAEKARLERGEYSETCSLVMRNMKKRFGSKKVAVKGVSLAIEVRLRMAAWFEGTPSYGLAWRRPATIQRGIVFGLLGPNGAGRVSIMKSALNRLNSC